MFGGGRANVACRVRADMVEERLGAREEKMVEVERQAGGAWRGGERR